MSDEPSLTNHEGGAQPQVQQHFVVFFSPGSFVSEQTSKPVESWDVEAAVQMARTIRERYGATPYGFHFITRGRGPEDLDSREIARSNFYWLGGKVETLEEIEARDDPKERILRGNMRGNGYDRIVINDNSWRFTGPMRADDVMLEFDPPGAAEPTQDGSTPNPKGDQ